MRNLLLYILLVFVFISCAKEITIDQPFYESKIVVDGYIETGRAANIHLTYSSPFLTHYDSVSIFESFINHAKITIESSDGKTEILTLSRDKKLFPPFYYRGRRIIGEEGLSYNIKVEVDGKVLTASTSIPKTIQGLETSLELMNDSTGFLKFRINKEFDNKIYLFPRIRSLMSDKNFHTTYHGVYESEYQEDSDVWHTIYRIDENRFHSLLGEKSVYDSYPKYQYDVNDTILLLVGTVDETSYKVLKSLHYDLSQSENPFSFNGSKVETNINGGIGRWTGIAAYSIDTLVLRDL